MAVTATGDARRGDEETPLLVNPETENAGDGSKQSASGQTARNIATFIILGVLIFTQGANISGLTVIQGAIATDLNALSKVSWLISSYVIAGSSTQPLFGRLSKIFSPRSCLFVSAMIFSAGLVVTSMAPSFAIFCTGRAFSGIGSGGIISTTIMIVLDRVSEQRRGLALGLANAGFTFGVSLGAIIFGALIEVTGWRELFLAQAPLSLIAGIAVLFVIPRKVDSADGTESTFQLLAKVDYLGVITITTAILLFLISLASAQVLIVPLLLSFPCLALFILVEAKFAADPIIPLDVLRSRGALFSSFATSVLMISRWAVLFYSPVYALAIREWIPSQAGAMLIPANLGFAIGSIGVGWAHIRSARSYYYSSLISIILFAATLFTASTVLSPSLSSLIFMATIFCNGFFTGAVLNYGLVHALHLSTSGSTFIVTSLLATFRGFGASFGSAIGGGIFARGLTSSFIRLRAEHNLPPNQDLLDKLLGRPKTVEELTGLEHDIARQSYVEGMSHLFLVMGLISLIAVAMQASTGTKSPKENEVEEDERRGEKKALREEIHDRSGLSRGFEFM